MIVGIGDLQETFFVHEDIICERSKFFKAACSKDWLENQDKTVKLPEQEVETFRMYVETVYTEKVDYVALAQFLAAMNGKARKRTSEDETQDTAAYLGLCKLWIAADFLGDSKVRNDIIDCVICMTPKTEGLTWEAIFFIASKTAVQAGLHRWLIDFLGRNIDSYQLGDFLNGLPAQSIQQLLEWFAEHKNPSLVGYVSPSDGLEFHT